MNKKLWQKLGWDMLKGHSTTLKKTNDSHYILFEMTPAFHWFPHCLLKRDIDYKLRAALPELSISN